MSNDEQVTLSAEERQEVVNQLKVNKQTYGLPYCPCIPPQRYNTPDNVCQCKEYKETGVCQCGVFNKLDKASDMRK